MILCKVRDIQTLPVPVNELTSSSWPTKDLNPISWKKAFFSLTRVIIEWHFPLNVRTRATLLPSPFFLASLQHQTDLLQSWGKESKMPGPAPECFQPALRCQGPFSKPGTWGWEHRRVGRALGEQLSFSFPNSTKPFLTGSGTCLWNPS